MNITDFFLYGILPLLGVAVLLLFIRFLKGPSLADRVIALDLIITVGIGIIVVYAIVNDQPTFMDIAMILALIAFLGTLSFSYYLKQKARDNE